MSRRLLLDGPDLDALVARVRREHGPYAKVVQAERVRSGGVGGFFAREYYEVLVDVPEPHELAEAGLAPAAGAPSMQGAPGAFRAATPLAAVPRGDSARSSAAPSSLEDLLDAADAAEAQAAGGAAPPAVGLSTDGSDFAEVLDRVRALVAAQNPAPAAQAPRPRALRAVPDDDAPATVTPAAARVVHRPVVSPRAGVTVPELIEVGVPSDLIASVLGPVPPAPGLRIALSSLLSHVERAPEIVRPSGGILAVVGEPGAVLTVAGQLARRAGIAPSRIVLAGDHGHSRFAGQDAEDRERDDRIVLEDADDAAELASRLSGSTTAVVVAVAIPSHRAGRERVGAVLDALRPAQLWAAVDVGRSAVETRRWLAFVGERRPLDALAAVGVEGSSAPAQVLAFGTPVGLLDGLVASAPVWAATLAERLDDAVWD
ncbi:hypothetical protein ACTVCO_05310 [Sanguibacter sp. A247]|uniref:hypothetical protein n=1 Tax=unclassified Sanguibacter TaxID=2645534 RepID=UPI003FD798EA